MSTTPATKERREFLRQTFAGIAGLSLTAAAAQEALSQPPAGQTSKEPYTSTSHRTDGKPPRVKTKLRINKL
ncbi:MAG: hypothetical protein IT423_19090, partial [Pirellulaceae bacterium]|nr:hypothetical protein [Pirellulaceae bacterium]